MSKNTDQSKVQESGDSTKTEAVNNNTTQQQPNSNQQQNYQAYQYRYTPQQGVQYPAKPKGGSVGRVIKILFSIFISVFLCILPFFIFLVFSVIVSSSIEPSSVNIDENKIYTAGNENSSTTTKLAIININGAISYSVPGSGVAFTSTSQNIIKQLDKARNDDSVKAVLLRFNTPGGEVSAAEPICDAIKATNNEKPVYSFIDTVGASLGYLLPNCGLDIYTRPSAITGSIGVVIQALDFVGVLENIGGDAIFITNSEATQKTSEDIFVEGSETYNTYQSILNESFEYFIDIVLEGRVRVNADITEAELRSYANGRIFSGLQAKEANLVDEVMEFEQTINSIIQKEDRLDGTRVDVIEYSIPPSPFSQILGNANNALESLDTEKQLNKGEIRIMMQMGLYNISDKKQVE